MIVTNEVCEIQGYVKLWRKSIDSAVFQDPELWKLWCLCLMKATHKPAWAADSGLKTPIKLEPGQFITGRFALHQDYYPKKRKNQKSPWTLWKWLKILENLGNLSIKTSNKFSIVSITNWDRYQDRNFQNEHQNEQQTSNRRATDEQQTSTYKNVKECKRIKTPPIGPPHEKPADKTAEQAKEVIAYLNQKTGRNYRDVSHITARLRDGATVEQCKHVIDVKLHDPFFRDNPKNLNPVTLFRPTHWDKYVNERIEDYQEEERKRNSGNSEGSSAYVPTPYELECLKVITHEEMTPEQIAAADAARERAMAQLREMPWWKDSSK